MLSRDQKKNLQEAIIDFLATRHPNGFPVSFLAGTNGVTRLVDFKFEDFDIAEALAVLCGLGLVQERRAWGSALKEYQITDDGAKLRYERQQE
jgi:hypothetical protein